MTFHIALFVSLALGLSNFAYQGLTKKDWSLALDRTWFQTNACIVMALAEYMLRM